MAIRVVFNFSHIAMTALYTDVNAWERIWEKKPVKVNENIWGNCSYFLTFTNNKRLRLNFAVGCTILINNIELTHHQNPEWCLISTPLTCSTHSISSHVDAGWRWLLPLRLWLLDISSAGTVAAAQQCRLSKRYLFQKSSSSSNSFLLYSSLSKASHITFQLLNEKVINYNITVISKLN